MFNVKAKLVFVYQLVMTSLVRKLGLCCVSLRHERCVPVHTCVRFRACHPTFLTDTEEYLENMSKDHECSAGFQLDIYIYIHIYIYIVVNLNIGSIYEFIR